MFERAKFHFDSTTLTYIFSTLKYFFPIPFKRFHAHIHIIIISCIQRNLFSSVGLSVRTKWIAILGDIKYKFIEIVLLFVYKPNSLISRHWNKRYGILTKHALQFCYVTDIILCRTLCIILTFLTSVSSFVNATFYIESDINIIF